jgi:hypothetical protein
MKLTSLFSFLNKMRNSFVKFYYKNSPKNLKLEKAGNSNQDLFHTATLLFSDLNVYILLQLKTLLYMP